MDKKQDLIAAAELLSNPSHASSLSVELRQAILESMSSPRPVQIGGSDLRCYVHSKTEDGRLRKFREPWTVEWLRRLPDAAVLYDVGANIGITVLLAAEHSDRGVRIVAIEPAPANFASLVRNIALNGFSDRVYPLALGLGARSAVTRLKLASFEPGGSMHSFGEIQQVHPDRELTAQGYHYCLCVRLDDLVRWEGLPFPTHLKIDVDGAELDVMAGAREVLADSRCRAVQIEVIDFDSTYQRSRQIVELMSSAGLAEVGRFKHRDVFPQVTDWQFSRR